MDRIYFIDHQHELNFKRVLMRWNKGVKDTEYQTACYILAVPTIFEKVESYIGTFEYPVSWIYRWEWKYTLSKQEENDDEEQGTEEIPYHLTSSMIQLGKFALNMWNGYKEFNLMDCISVLDIKHYRVVLCGIDMRMGKFK